MQVYKWRTNMFGIARLISGVTVALFRHTLGRLATAAKRSAGKREALRATRPMHGTHYRLSRAPRHGGHCNHQALEVLCPDGRWRRFVWTTNHSNPLCADGRRSLLRSWCHGGGERERLAREVFYMSDKFIGPPSMGPESAPSEDSLRNTSHIGLYALDPNCREANAQLGHPWHGRDYCALMDDTSVASSWADRLGDLRLLPCYDTVAGRLARLKRPGLVARVGASALRIAVITAIVTPLIYYVLLCCCR